MDYLGYVSNYFNINTSQIKTLITENHPVAFLKTTLGPLTRQLSSLQETVEIEGIHNAIVNIITITHQRILKNEKLIVIYKLLVADQYKIMKLVIFDNDDLNRDVLQVNNIIRLFEVYYDTRETYEHVIKLKRGGNVYKVPFHTPGMRSTLTIPTLSLEDIGDYVSNVTNVEYIQALGIIHCKGAIKNTEHEEIFLFGESYRVKLRLHEELKQIVLHHCQNKYVELQYLKLKYGRDSLELRSTEFTKLNILKPSQKDLNEKNYNVYEYPAQIMSLREMIDSGMVAISTSAITHTEERKTDNEKLYLVVILYDSTAVVRLNLFDDHMIAIFKNLPKFTKLKFISGIYKKSMYQDETYANALPVASIRKKDKIVEISDDYLDPTVTPLATMYDPVQPVLTEGKLVDRGEIKDYQTRKGELGKKLTFTIEQDEISYKITTYSDKHVKFIMNASLRMDFKFWWIIQRRERFILTDYGRITN